ncbi:MAG: CDP-alcohol phosphatidyltransferase family protein [Micromonosporaceae bacterium]
MQSTDDALDGRATRQPAMVAPVSPAVPTVFSANAAPAAIPLLPGEQTLARRVKFAVVNACTVASILLGLSAVFLAVQGEIRLAALALLGCVVLDGLDGALARRFGVASPFGAQMDSMADLCSFGIATPLVAYFWLAEAAPLPLLVPLCVLVTVCAAIRLARFNVSPKDGRFFCGVPTTMAAAIIALTVLLNPEPRLVAVALTIVAGLAVLMVSSFPYAKLARIAKLPPWLWVLPVVAAFANASVTFAVLVGIYLLSGPLLWLRQRRTRPAGRPA